MSETLAGTGTLVRLAARRDRVMVSAWLAVLLVVVGASASATTGLYPSEAERVSAAEAINLSPGIVALYGPILDVHSVGELAMTKMTVLYAVFVAVMTLFVVRRHTRLEEEAGEAELVGGTAVGRDAPLAAAVAFGVAISVLLGVLAAAIDAACGLPVTGSIAFGASWLGTGLVGVGLTALACQLSASARTCATIAGGAIGALFALRAVGDTTDASFLSWLTPFGWNTRLRAFSDTRWWVLLLYVALAAALVAAAHVVRRHRDLGGGVIAPRPGPATGSPRLANVLALTLRVQAPMLTAWTVAVAACSLVFALISPSFDAFDSHAVRDMLSRLGGPGALHDMLLGAVVSMLGLIVTCFPIAVAAHAGGDEQDGRTEQVLATATARSRAFLATAIVGLGGALWLLLVAGVFIAIGAAGSSSHSPVRLLASPLAQAPAVWTVAAVAILLLAVSGRWGVAGWGVLVLFGTLGVVGELLGLPGWVTDLSPYAHAPQMPYAGFAWGPALTLTAIAAVVLGIAWWRYRGRDIG